jgi:hypothetical protein
MAAKFSWIKGEQCDSAGSALLPQGERATTGGIVYLTTKGAV